MQHLKIYSRQDVLAHTNPRRFETRLGQQVQVIKNPKDLEESLQQTSARYILVGVPEWIGIKANHGYCNEASAWQPFLESFLSSQSNDFLGGEEILLLGHFDFSEVDDVIEQSAQTIDEKVDAYRHAVNMIDDEVEQLIHIITQNRKLPIVVGGGQNNAYPCIKGAAKGWFKSGVIPIAQINAINVDACPDYGPMEGRHSGNAFSYAEEDGYLEKYCVVGLEENQIQQNVWIDMVNNPFIDCITYEDIFLHEKRTFEEAINHATEFTIDTLCGIELDMNCIENGTTMPTGISAKQARQYLHVAALDSQPAYLHISECSKENTSSGKLLSFLVTDFVKALQQGY
ncbi:arginase family protein [Parasediminibacterium sp. JCM 36343]|uniref:arginase family protein n=1 Tax=Parasediminibacterium sp. JCM 36343 TaxID=3374279 RepID=UPI0039798806